LGSTAVPAVLDMGRRWSVKEENALAEVKRRLKDQLANRPQFPEGLSTCVCGRVRIFWANLFTRCFILYP